MHLVGLFNMSIDLAWTTVMDPIAQKNDFLLMDVNRFKALLMHSNGFPMDGREASDGEETWIQRNTFLRNMNELEKLIF